MRCLTIRRGRSRMLCSHLDDPMSAALEN